MEGITSANLVAELSTLDLVQTIHIISMLTAQLATVALDIVDVGKSIRDHEEQGQLCVEYYQRASQKKRQILEPGLRKWLANNERVLVEFKQRKKLLETEFMSSPTILEMVIKHLWSLLDKEATEQNETASEMMGGFGKAEGGPLKRMKEMLKENADKVTFSNRETSQFKCLVLVHKKDIEFHRSNIKRWNKCIQDSEKLIQELEKTNKEYKEDIEKNRQEIVELKQEEEVILAIQKQGEAREEEAQRVLQAVLQQDMTRFLEGELEKAGLSLEKESEGDQDQKIADDGEKKMIKNKV
ncbi:hypothetical protein BGAL_0311g00220 [Botrytis galanthina]|uniref:Uncharacterized protein n=1 Tax=Botrytis galanthina TaxID=278940 RepID=A0A4S8QV61_9HELO|nr:hypothetical protein BGAL_0311g00220 [Botrytis galanthina]